MDGPKYAKSKKAKFFSTPTYVYEKLNAEQCFPWSPLPIFLKYMVPGSYDSEFVVEGYMDLNTI